MGRNQKLCYMALGTAILVVGLGAGIVFSPQRDGVFDEIRCGKLITVDETGNEHVTVGRGIVIENPSNKAEVVLTAGLRDDFGAGIWLNNRNGTPAMQLGSRESGNFIIIHDKAGENRVTLASLLDVPSVIELSDEAGRVKWSAP